MIRGEYKIKQNLKFQYLQKCRYKLKVIQRKQISAKMQSGKLC